MRTLFCTIAAGAALAAPAASAAIRVADVKTVAVELAGKYAQDVQIKPTSDGTRVYLAGKFSSGLKYLGDFYSCNAAKTECERLSLEIAFIETGVSIADMNPWNQKRFTQAYIDEDGDPNIQLFTIAAGPYAAVSLRALLSFWETECWDFHDFVYEGAGSKKVSASAAAEIAEGRAAPARVDRRPIEREMKNARD